MSIHGDGPRQAPHNGAIAYGACPVTRAAIIGCGVMGSGITQAFAQHGITAVGYDPDEAQRALAWERVTTGPFGVERARSRGKLTDDHADDATRRMSFVDRVEAAVEGADIVVECIPERLALKLETFRALDAMTPAQTILASNTSGFPIEALAAATSASGAGHRLALGLTCGDQPDGRGRRDAADGRTLHARRDGARRAPR